ncbi:MAG: hypothetical protein RR744_00060 [Cellulosilyticaceae bacterium]
MIESKSELNKQIVSYLRAMSDANTPIYNSATLTTTPVESTRIEFRLTNFSSTGQIYQTGNPVNDFEIGSISEYKCQLIIRVIGTPSFSNSNMGRISGGIQTHGLLEEYVRDLYIENETIRVQYYPIEEDGVIYTMAQLTVRCYVGIEFKQKVDYFTKVNDVKITIK